MLGLKDSEINTLVLKENIILVTFSTLVGSLLSFKFYILLCTSLAPEDMAFPEKLNWLSFPICTTICFPVSYQFVFKA